MVAVTAPAADTRRDRWLEPVPLARLALLRVLAYVFVPLDVLWWRTGGGLHAFVDPVLYEPLLVARVLPLPVPDEAYVVALLVALLVAAGAALVAAVTGRWARLTGAVVAVLYLQWMVVSFSYGKVDHDRFAYLVLLAVLPTVGAAGLRSARLSEAAGFAVRAVQVAVVATYFLAALAKLRFGGPEWVMSATVTRAVVRRGTVLGEWLLDVPQLLVATQWGIMAAELAAPLLLVVGLRWRQRLAAGFLVFHLITFAMISIIFLPHVLCLAAFFPLERVVGVRVTGDDAPLPDDDDGRARDAGDRDVVRHGGGRGAQERQAFT